MTEHILPESTNACPTSPTTYIQPELLPVIQADRDCAARFAEAAEMPALAVLLCGGLRDNHDFVTIAARHRLTCTTPTLGDMVMVPRELTQAMLDATCATADDDKAMRETWADLLSAAPASPIPTSVNGAGEREALLDGEGWVYWNPDAGEEYASSHPVKSGECCDAEQIRKSTAQEDALWRAMQQQFARAEALSPALDNTAVEGQS